MVFTSKLFSELGESDLQELLVQKVTENKSLDYKQKLPGNSDNDKKEFLADVSSFANAVGGYIIFGIEEDGGFPAAIPGLQGIDMDKEILRLEGMVQAGIAPRIPGLSMRSIALTNGTYALAIKIPQSWASPHMVIYAGSSRFFSRNSAGKYPLDVVELRSAFLASDSISNRIREFLQDRVNRVIVENTPILLPEGAKAILHLIPINNIFSQDIIDLEVVESERRHLVSLYVSNYASPNDYRINLDGLVTYDMLKDETTPFYTQIFRNGIIEAVSQYLLRQDDEHRRIPSVYFEKAIIDTCSALLSFQKRLGIEPPIAIFLTLTGVKGYQMAVSPEKNWWMKMNHIRNRVIDRDLVQTPDIIIESYEVENLSALLRPLFDFVWNAAGWLRSMNYDTQGNWSENTRPQR